MTAVLVWGGLFIFILWCVQSLQRTVDSRPCPACRQIISKRATVCPRCHSRVEAR